MSTTQCPFCQSESIIRKEIRHNKNYDIQRYFCKTCEKKFSFNSGFERNRVPAQAITGAMQLYFTGESLRNVQKFLLLQGVKISHVSIYKWIQKYISLMEKYLQEIKPQVGDTWRADELWIKVKGNPKYLFALIDNDTRFWLSEQIADKKGISDVRPLFREGRELAHMKPEVLVTDGAPNFVRAFKKEYESKLTQKRSIHMRHIHIKGDLNNNRMERFNGEIRGREKVMRGLKNEDSPIIEGMKIYHNFIRPHMALVGMTPSEKAGIKVEGENKWITIIQNASHKHPTNFDREMNQTET